MKSPTVHKVKHCHDKSSFKYTGELLLLSIPPAGDIFARSLRFILVFHSFDNMAIVVYNQYIKNGYIFYNQGE